MPKMTPPPIPFEIVSTSKYLPGNAVVKCPVCGITRWNTAMKVHIAKSPDKKHKAYYKQNTVEVVTTKRVWKI